MDISRKGCLSGMFALALLLLSGFMGWNYWTTQGIAAPQAAAPAAPTAPLKWKKATPVQRKQAAAAIRAQLDAFDKGDWNRAVTYQSAGLKKNFPSTAAFRAMMEKSYPQFVHSKKIEFGPDRAAGNVVQLAIKLTGKDGVLVSAVYSMIKEKAGYRIEGVSGGFAAPPSNSGDDDQGNYI